MINCPLFEHRQVQIAETVRHPQLDIEKTVLNQNLEISRTFRDSVYRHRSTRLVWPSAVAKD